MTVYQPADAAELAEIIAASAAHAQSLEIVAGGSKRSLGRPVDSAHMLDLARIAGVVDYDPHELLLTVRPATRLDDIEALLRPSNQMLAFEPADWRRLLGSEGTPTLGGVLATNQSGPRRIKAGAARDHFLAFSAVDGRGDAWKAGGKVMKNVTGYDMCKLQAGAFGTMSVLTEVTVKVMPRPETVCTLLLPAADPAASVRAMADALNSPHEVSAAAWLPEAALRRSRVAGALSGGRTALRLEGPAPSVAHRIDGLRAMFGAAEGLSAEDSAVLWQEIGSVRPLIGEAHCVWRLCPTPASAALLLERLKAQFGALETLFDWGGGLVWLGLDAERAGSDAGAKAVRAAIAEAGGHATLFAASADLRAEIDVFEPLAPPLAALTARIKQGFDPRGILNPRRLAREF